MKYVGPLLVLLLAASVWTGCPDKEDKPVVVEKKDDTPKMSDAEAIVGTWASGQNKMKFSADGKFIWDLPRACGAPPCPMKREQGTYELKRGQIYMLVATGNNMTVEFKINWNPRTLWVKSSQLNQEWKLPFIQ